MTCKASLTRLAIGVLESAMACTSSTTPLGSKTCSLLVCAMVLNGRQEAVEGGRKDESEYVRVAVTSGCTRDFPSLRTEMSMPT